MKYIEKQDIDEISKVISEDVKWYFIGRHPSAGIKNGIDEVIAFYDKTFSDGKIIEGRHFFSYPIALDEFFSVVAEKENTVVK